MATNKSVTIIMPIVSKIYCSPSEVFLALRRRPNVANGGGFAVVDCTQKVVFSVDAGGKKQELILRDSNGNALLLIRRRGVIVEALSLSRQWQGFNYDQFLASPNLVFTLKELNSCFSNKTTSIKLFNESNGNGNFEIRGDFSARSCSIVNSTGQIIAEIGMEEEVEQVIRGRDLYYVKVMPGIDQAFVFGVIAVLDYTNDGSTRCC